MATKKKNDQGEIIKLLKEKNFIKVWENLKYVGYTTENNMNKRFIIFNKACDDFDPFINNNFILFYKNYLKFFKIDKNSTFIITENFSFIRQLKNEHVSPTGELPQFVKDLEKINP